MFVSAIFPYTMRPFLQRGQVLMCCLIFFSVFANCSNEKSYTSDTVGLIVDVDVSTNIQIFNASL